MKKNLAVIFVLILTLAVASFASAQENKLAFFKIDTDLATEGYQGGSVVTGIGGGEQVGFAVYVKNADQLRGFSVDFTWEAAKATYRSASGEMIEEDDVEINGLGEITLAEEDNMLGSVAGVGEVKEDGHYKIDFAKLGGDAVASTEFGLVYLLVLKTVDGFTADDSFKVIAKISVSNDVGVVKSLGERNFYVNGGVDVKTSTWGEVKSQFKGF